jgi:formamidopyrimidine-DNA glycosylase
LSPVQLTKRLDIDSRRRLHVAVQKTLTRWRDLLGQESGADFLEKVTAFRPQMAVHGKYGRPCPEYAAPVARIRYKSNETNYCPGCQTKRRILSDRSLSRLLKDDWPGTL